MPRPKKSDKPKATNAESAKRTNTIYNMLLIGASRADILQYTAENWQLEERATDEYIARATAILETKIAQSQDIEFNRALQRRELLFQKNMKIQDYKAALAVEIDKSKLLQLYPATKQEVTGKDGAPIKTEQVNVNINAENAHDAGNILRQLIELGAIPPTRGESGHDSEAE